MMTMTGKALPRAANRVGCARAVCAAVLCAALVGVAGAQEPETPELGQPRVPNAPTAPIAPVKGGTITGMTGQVANDTVKGAALMDEARKALGGVAQAGGDSAARVQGRQPPGAGRSGARRRLHDSARAL
jgi:hypothetical protein